MTAPTDEIPPRRFAPFKWPFTLLWQLYLLFILAYPPLIIVMMLLPAEAYHLDKISLSIRLWAMVLALLLALLSIYLQVRSTRVEVIPAGLSLFTLGFQYVIFWEQLGRATIYLKRVRTEKISYVVQIPGLKLSFPYQVMGLISSILYSTSRMPCFYVSRKLYEQIKHRLIAFNIAQSIEQEFGGETDEIKQLRDENLGVGGSLSQAFLQKKRVEKGHYTIYQPEAPKGSGLHFEWVMLHSRRSRYLLAARIQKHLFQPGTYLVLEDTCSKITDEWIPHRTGKIVTHRSEVFGFLDDADAALSIDNISTFLLFPKCLPSVGFLTSLGSDHAGLQDGDEIDAATLDALARNTTAFFMRTANGAGHIFWQERTPFK